MKLLSIETSGNLCGACISENNSIIDKIEIENGLTHSETLMPLIKRLLQKNNLSIFDFDGFVCDIGPGSFTGIRIGVATVKAFVDSSNLKYSGVSSLEALAYNCTTDGLICSIIDARNENCYFALYKHENNNYIELLPPTACTINEMIDNLKKYNEFKISFVGDGFVNYKEIIKISFNNFLFSPDISNTIQVSNLALAGYNAISNNKIKELYPMYLKKPQAQRQLEEGILNKNGN